MAQFNTLAEIQEAVKAGRKVHWKNAGYVVGVDMLGQWYIAWQPWSKNPNYVSMFWTDGVTSDYSPEDFYSVEKPDRWVITVYDGYSTNIFERKGSYEQVVDSCAGYPPGYLWTIKSA